MTEPFLRQVALGPLANLVYLIGDPATRQAFLVDPAWDPAGLASEVERQGYTLAGVLLTHTHPDHLGGELFGQHIPGLAELRAAHDVPVFVHELEAERAASIGRTPSARLHVVSDGAVVALGELTFSVLHTPGHSLGSVCYHLGRHLISGDTLFVQGCGRVDLPGSDVDAMWHSLQRLARLPAETTVYPGHRSGPTPTSTIGAELVQNMYLRVPTLDGWRLVMSQG